MKRNALLLLTAVSLSTAVAGTSFAATAGTAQGHKHEHGSEKATVTLQLNNAGEKWETDAALRQAMGNLREVMAASLHKIHENQLSTSGYASLANKVESEVGNIVANCKLGTRATTHALQHDWRGVVATARRTRRWRNSARYTNKSSGQWLRMRSG
jgi:hypothetical protein